jgi:hypothetical protein
MFEAAFILHKGKRILRIDYSGLSIDEALAAMPAAMALIAAESPGSVRALTIWDTSLNKQVAEAIGRQVAVNAPYIRASAVVTARPFQKVVFEGMRAAGRSALKTFDDEQVAKDWLAAQ